MQLNLNIPDISHLKPNSVSIAAKHIIGAGLKNREADALTTNFVRLVDLAVDEYTLGREAFLEFMTEREGFKVGRVIRASSHYEVCISTVKRAIDHLKAIRGHPGVPQKLKDLLPKKSIKILSGSVEGQVKDMRDAVIHLEGKIKKGEIVDGPFFLSVMENHLLLGKHKILYSDLVTWLTELHTISAILTNYPET